MARRRKKRNRTSSKAVTAEYKSTVRCSGCGTEAAIFRPKGQDRESGHRKHVWCFACSRVTLHFELGPLYEARWSWPAWGREDAA